LGTSPCRVQPKLRNKPRPSHRVKPLPLFGTSAPIVCQLILLLLADLVEHAGLFNFQQGAGFIVETSSNRQVD
jgi:hypothetical protein